MKNYIFQITGKKKFHLFCFEWSPPPIICPVLGTTFDIGFGETGISSEQANEETRNYVLTFKRNAVGSAG